MECWHRADAVPAAQVPVLQALLCLLQQLRLPPVQPELCAAVIQGVPLPAHDVQQVVGAVWLVENAVQDAEGVAPCLCLAGPIR